MVLVEPQLVNIDEEAKKGQNLSPSRNLVDEGDPSILKKKFQYVHQYSIFFFFFFVCTYQADSINQAVVGDATCAGGKIDTRSTSKGTLHAGIADSIIELVRSADQVNIDCVSHLHGKILACAVHVKAAIAGCLLRF